MTDKSRVQSLDRAFDLLELLCGCQGGMSLAALSAETGLNKSTAHRLLGALAERGYVRREAEGAVYHAGMRLCELGSRIVENLDVVGMAKAPMERLSRRTGETVHLAMREGTEIVYVHKVESIHGAIRMFSRIGMRRPLYCTGVGKAILASLPPEEAMALWEESDRRRCTPNTITEAEPFRRELARVRRDGYALDNEENEQGVRCVAAAVPDWRGRAAYALSISAPVSRMTDGRIQDLIPPLLETREAIAAVLGGARGAAGC